MRPLFDPDRHEPLDVTPWDAHIVREAIHTIVADAMTAARDGLWPSHPQEDGAPDDCPTLFRGACGILWALSHLADEGVIPSDERIPRWISALPGRYAAQPVTGDVVPSYFLGESGILLLNLRMQPSRELADRLFASVERNIHNPTLEALWGAPGTVLAAIFAYELTAEPRWRDLILANLDALQQTWLRDDTLGCDVWTQDLYGRTHVRLGAAHGFAGNAFAFFRALPLLPERNAGAVLERVLQTLRRTATVQDQRANWPPSPGADRFLVQWCHGAPGVITSCGRAPASPELDELLLMGGELVWQAGPPRKGANLCHGTAGNGSVMLTLFSRTGDSRWLDRARQFAMHSIRQVTDARRTYNQGRYSLWTGDLGTAVFLWQCLTEKSGLPTLDF